MITALSLLENFELLIAQRLELIHSRYVGYIQLKQHDQQLIEVLQLLQHQTEIEELPVWLSWLLDGEVATVLPLASVTPFADTTAAQLLLIELKLVLHHLSPAPLLRNMLQQGPEQQALAWALAARLHFCLDPFTAASQMTVASLAYLGLSGQLALLGKLQGYLRSTTNNDRATGQVAAYLLGTRGSEVQLISQLKETGQLGFFELMVLMCGAPERDKTNIINLLIQCSATEHLAIYAMGFSGQLKFIPLLTELAQQELNSEAAHDSLALLLGVIEADNVLADQRNHGRIEFVSAAERHLAGSSLCSETLAKVWRNGNQLQRTVAACHASLLQPGLPVLDPHRLMGGKWHPV